MAFVNFLSGKVKASVSQRRTSVEDVALMRARDGPEIDIGLTDGRK
jgi:hypothetical protein